jgi:hypothetical protein
MAYSPMIRKKSDALEGPLVGYWLALGEDRVAGCSEIGLASVLGRRILTSPKISGILATTRSALQRNRYWR